ncbi:MAG: PEP-CTERM sorting domain-containing protein [Verrucomicrobia bacterium]|nr:PEP-CTERM sorting domain-containing protein [Verrucomicrobiota bacterium]
MFNNISGSTNNNQRPLGWQSVEIIPNLVGSLHGSVINPAGQAVWSSAGAVGPTFEIWGLTWGAGGVHLYRQIGDGLGAWTDNANAVTAGTTANLVLGVEQGGSPLDQSRFNGNIAALQAFDNQLDAAAVEAQIAALHTTWFTNVPEPTSLVLTMFAGGLLLIRRKR